MRSHFAFFTALSALALFLTVTSSAHAQCRDARGEPAACVAQVETPLSGPTPVVAVSVSVTEPEPEPEEPNRLGHEHRDHETGYFELGLLLEGVDTRQLHFSPMTPRSVPELARGSVAVGAGTAFENALGGFTFALGARPLPWLRLPEVRLSAGFGDLDGASVDMVGGSQPMRATFHDLYYLRAEIAAGLDFDLDPVRFFALGHIAIAGYFASVRIDHATLGDLGTDTFAEDVWEAGWTVGMEIELDPRIAYSLAYRHIHTGVESNAFMFGVNVRLD